MNRRNMMCWLAGLICGLVFFAFAGAPSTAAAAEEMVFETGSARFTYESRIVSLYPKVQTATITKIEPLREELVIPAVMDGCHVTKIGRNVLSGAAGSIVTSIVMKEGIETVDASAFTGLENLKTLYLPDSLQSIKPAAFKDCRALTDIRMPAAMNVRNIENDAFLGIGTDTLVLPDGTDLMAVGLEKYRKYGRDFYGPPMSAYQDGFAYIVREDGGAIIIQGLDTSKAKIQVPAFLGNHPVREIGISAFEGNWGIQSLVLPEGLEIIAEKAFSNCVNLTSVQLPSSLSEIGSRAFYRIGEKSSPELLSEDVRCAVDWYLGPGIKDSTGQWTYSLLADGSAAITDCVLTPPVLEFPAAVDGHPVVFIEDALASVNDQVISLMKDIKKIVIPEGVTMIGEYAFSSFEALQEVSFPSTLKTIGKGAFSYNSLKSIALPEGLETIGARAFDSHEVKHLTLPAGLKSVGNEAFASPYKKFPSRVTILGYRTELSKGIFGYWPTGSMETPESWHDYYADEPIDTGIGFKPHTITLECYQGSTADETYQVNIKKKYLKPGPETVRTAPAEPVLQAGLFPQDELISEVIVPEGVETIADHAFEGLKALRKVSLPSTLKAIGAHAFDGCSALEKLSLPKKLVSLGEACFRGCVSLAGITLSEGITAIPDSAFEGCSALAAVQLPKSGVTRIGAKAFASCGALKKFKFTQGLEEIGSMAFDSCASLTEAKLPDSVRKIGPSAFRNCRKLKTVDLGTGLTELGDYAFLSNGSLTSLTVPNTLTVIGKGILDGHRSGLKVVCEAGSAMDAWLQDNATDVKVSYRKKK